MNPGSTFLLPPPLLVLVTPSPSLPSSISADPLLVYFHLFPCCPGHSPSLLAGLFKPMGPTPPTSIHPCFYYLTLSPWFSLDLAPFSSSPCRTSAVAGIEGSSPCTARARFPGRPRECKHTLQARPGGMGFETAGCHGAGTGERPQRWAQGPL